MDADRAEPDADDEQRRPSWRQLSRDLWVGHDGTTTLGTIEHGARYVFVDADGAARPGRRSLSEAQEAATRPIPVQTPRTPRTALRDRLAERAGLLVLVAGALLLAIACWLAGRAMLSI